MTNVFEICLKMIVMMKARTDVLTYEDFLIEYSPDLCMDIEKMSDLRGCLIVGKLLLFKGKLFDVSEHPDILSGAVLYRCVYKGAPKYPNTPLVLNKDTNPRRNIPTRKNFIETFAKNNAKELDFSFVDFSLTVSAQEHGYGIRFLRSNLDYASFRDTCRGKTLTFLDSSLVGADFSRAQGMLSFSNTNLTNSIFNRASPYALYIENSSLDGADFSKANLTGSSVDKDIDFSGVKVDGALFLQSAFDKLEDSQKAVAICLNDSQKTRGLDLQGYFFELEANDLVLSGANLSNTSLRYCTFHNCDFSDTKWFGADMSLYDVQFLNCSFVGADLRKAKLDGVYFENTDFSRADIRGCSLSYCTFGGETGVSDVLYDETTIFEGKSRRIFQRR